MKALLPFLASIIMTVSLVTADTLCSFSFPESYNGSQTTVIDRSPNRNNATTRNSDNSYSNKTPFDPSGISSAEGSFDCSDGNAFVTDKRKLLANSIIAEAGGYTYDVWFNWNGNNDNGKIIDYAGTEILLINAGRLTFGVVDNPGYNEQSVSTNGLDSDVWYHAIGVFDSRGNTVDAEGGLAGIMKLYVNNEKVGEFSWGKGVYGDNLNRGIGFGRHPNGGENFQGSIYNPQVILGVVEPAQVPPAPRSIQASKWSFYDRIQLSWDANTNTSFYVVYRNTSDSINTATEITNIVDTAYNDFEVVAGQIYYYWVKAGNDEGISFFSPSDYGYRSIQGQPLAPSNVAATSGEFTDKVKLTWTASSSQDVDRYKILRNTTEDISTAIVLSTNTLDNFYDDNSAVVPQTYYYWVQSGNGTLWSGASNSADGFAAALSDPAFIPWPQSVRIDSGDLLIDANSSIVVSDPELYKLGMLFSEEIHKHFGVDLAVSQGLAEDYDISLKFTDGTSLTGEMYRVTVSNNVIIEAENYNALAMGTITLLQAMKKSSNSISVQKMQVNDQPFSEFRAVMQDVGRQLNEIQDIKDCITLCRLYKIRYLQLHLTDNQGWTFPSTKYPLLGTQNTAAHGGVPPRKYTLAELNNLVEYATTRGVIIIPEIDWPGHCQAMLRAMGDFFDPANVGVVNVATEEVYSALDDIVGEVMAVFHTSPYFHFGADEVGLGSLYDAYRNAPLITDNNIDNGSELFTYFMERMVAMCEKYNCKPMAWEGHRAVNDTLRKILMVEWATMYYDPNTIIADGYTIVNAAWCPLYIVEYQTWIDPQNVYDWNLYTWGNYPSLPRLYPEAYWYSIEPTDKVIGGMYCSWENPGDFQITGLRPLVAPMSERIWNPNAAHRYEDFQIRFEHNDKILDSLLKDIPEPGTGLLISIILAFAFRIIHKN